MINATPKMDTLDIDKKLADVSVFQGAFAYDILPPKPDEDFSLVINTSDSTLPGDHWLVLLRKDTKIYFIDSYGRNYSDPTFDANFTKTITNYIGGEKIFHNKKWLQRLTSNACGAYCIYFIRELNKQSFRSCLSVFSVDLMKNDKYVLKYLDNI